MWVTSARGGLASATEQAHLKAASRGTEVERGRPPPNFPRSVLRMHPVAQCYFLPLTLNGGKSQKHGREPTHLVALVRAGARFENGKLIERPRRPNRPRVRRSRPRRMARRSTEPRRRVEAPSRPLTRSTINARPTLRRPGIRSRPSYADLLAPSPQPASRPAGCHRNTRSGAG
jgi:hypothetical protein